MVVAACSDGKSFYTAVDGGSIRKYPINVDDLTQITDDVFTLKQSHVTCVDSTRDTGVPNTFIIGCADGNLHLCSPNGQVEKSVPAQTGGVTCLSVSPNRLSILSGGEHGVVKMWRRNGILQTNLAGVGGAVT
jgi:WD40 repeat protein